MKKVLALLSAVVMMMAIAGCGGKTDEELLQGTVWQLTELSEEAPTLFPVSTAQSCLGGESFKIEFLSDGSVLIDAVTSGGSEYTSEAYYSYALVDGRIKIAAPLGSTCISEYEISKNELKLSDSTGYAVFKPFDGKDSAKVETKESDAAEEVAEVTEEKEIDPADNLAEVEPAPDASAVVADEASANFNPNGGIYPSELPEGTILTWDTVNYDDYDPCLLGDVINTFYTVEDVKKIWEANKLGPGCYQPEIGLANCMYAWGVVGGDLRTRINIKLKDGYSFNNMPQLRPEMLDVTITDACYAWCPIDEGEDWGYEELPDVTVDPKDIEINNFAFNPANPYVQIIIPDMYGAYDQVEGGQFYVVNWRWDD